MASSYIVSEILKHFGREGGYCFWKHLAQGLFLVLFLFCFVLFFWVTTSGARVTPGRLRGWGAGVRIWVCPKLPNTLQLCCCSSPLFLVLYSEDTHSKLRGTICSDGDGTGWIVCEASASPTTLSFWSLKYLWSSQIP